MRTTYVRFNNIVRPFRDKKPPISKRFIPCDLHHLAQHRFEIKVWIWRHIRNGKEGVTQKALWVEICQTRSNRTAPERSKLDFAAHMVVAACTSHGRRRRLYQASLRPGCRSRHAQLSSLYKPVGRSALQCLHNPACLVQVRHILRSGKKQPGDANHRRWMGSHEGRRSSVWSPERERKCTCNYARERLKSPYRMPFQCLEDTVDRREWISV